MKKTHILPLFALVLLSTPSFADPMDATPNSSTSDTRIKTLMYNDSDVYVIRTKFGYQTNVVFGDKEEIQTISVGDRSLWQIIPAGNRLFIRPMDENITTNMTLITNKHSYEFDIKAIDNKGDNNIYVARFIYPDKRSSSQASSTGYSPVPAYTPTSRAMNSMPSDARPVRPNYNYTYTGPDALAPLQVFDDGRSTTIKYRNLGQTLPLAFGVAPDGREYPLSYSVQETSLVVSTVVPQIILRNDTATVKIYNESLSPRY